MALARAIEQAIETGALREGDRLPPQRELAWRLGVDTSTVTKAFREAARLQLVQGEIGRGTYVLGQSRAAEMFAARRGGAEMIDLSLNHPAPFRAGDFSDVLRGLAEERGTDWQGYHDAALVDRLRQAGARWLAARGVDARPEEIVPVAGTQAALSAIVSILGLETVAVEALSYPGVPALIRQHRLVPVPLPLDTDGVDPEVLGRAGAGAVILVPNLHNPTGITSSPGRKRALLDAAARAGLLVIEDDGYGPLGDGAPLAAMESGAEILMLATFSKSVAPGLRLGILWGRGRAFERLRREEYATSWIVAPLLMRIAAQWIEDGTAFARVAEHRAEIAARHRLAVEAFPQLAWRPPAPHVFVETPADAADFERAGVRVAPTAAFATAPGQREGVRISLAAAPDRGKLRAALARCALVVAAAEQGAG